MSSVHVGTTFQPDERPYFFWEYEITDNQVANNWLTPLQVAFLNGFFSTEAGQRFFLTEGTSLAAFHAGALLEVRRLSRLPVTTPPLALVDLQSFMLALADRLLDQIRPPEDSG
ncbi:hypothetical protein [Candidatus Amarolinea aalborgensis]|jgi:hypothetical protein|uniref:hypothetical protein n=1 Tax=Candidatus Amarolinea aalborgensis TaxID=2249329 RepID=UPI003BF9ABC0